MRVKLTPEEKAARREAREAAKQEESKRRWEEYGRSRAISDWDAWEAMPDDERQLCQDVSRLRTQYDATREKYLEHKQEAARLKIEQDLLWDKWLEAAIRLRSIEQTPKKDSHE